MMQVSAGARHSLVLTAAGEVFAFGNGELGQLGLGDQVDRPVPTRLQPLPAGVPAFIVAAGDHSLAVCRRSPTDAEFVVPGAYHSMATAGRNREILGWESVA